VSKTLLNVLNIDKPHKDEIMESDSEITMCDKMQMYNIMDGIPQLYLKIFGILKIPLRLLTNFCISSNVDMNSEVRKKIPTESDTDLFTSNPIEYISYNLNVKTDIIKISYN
jgi:hypothetical protein